MPKEKYVDVLKCLRKNSRDTLTNISKVVKSPVSTIHDRVKATEKRYISKYTSIVDFSKLGYNLRVSILLKAFNKTMISDFLISNRNVNTAYDISGSHDFLIDCVFQDKQEYDSFLSLLNMLPVSNMQSNMVMNNLKTEEFLN